MGCVRMLFATTTVLVRKWCTITTT